MRDDLARLTDEVLIDLANKGLVKRAHKMLSRDQGPVVTWAGPVPSGVFPDGVETSLPRDVSLTDAPCSCGAATVCRHRLALVLACRGVAPDPPAVWTPAFDDASLIERLGASLVQRAERGQGGVVVDLVPGVVPEARLPTCSVRFMVQGELGYATCSCDEPRCVHVAHAVWAFRRQAQGRVELATAELRVDLEGLDALVALTDDVLWSGVADSVGVAQRVAGVDRALARAGLAWPLEACRQLGEQIDAYARRSAAYAPERLCELLVDPWARRAALGDGTLSAEVLGASVAAETRLEKARFVGLGCRLSAIDGVTRVELFLADRAGTVLVIRRGVSGEALVTGPQIARRRQGGVTLGRLATGRVLTQVARRRANRELLLGTGAGNTSVRTGDWDELPPGVLGLPESPALPAALRPRHLAGGVRVLTVEAVDAVGWDPASQAVVAWTQVEGARCRVVLAHAGVAPGACAALAAALQAGPTRVSGHVARRGGAWQLTPLAVEAAGGLVVPALAKAASVHADVAVAAPESPLAEAVHRALSTLDEGAHRGLAQGSASWMERLAAEAVSLRRVGLVRTAERLDEVVAAARAARVDGERAALLVAWRRARVRLVAVGERA